MIVSRREAVALLLARQGLTTPGYAGAAPHRSDLNQVVDCIQQMGVLQIDTIHVVARSPYLVLWSRLGAFEPTLLERALVDRRIFEYWSHEASFLPIEHLPYSRALMLERNTNPKRNRFVQRRSDDAEVINAVLAHAYDGAEVRSSDFERAIPGSGQGWWDWKPEKMALEILFMLGELTVSRRDRFHRIYRRWKDHYPEFDDASLPNAEAVADHHVRIATRALGVGTRSWIADYFRRPQAETKLAIGRLVASGELMEVEIDGLGPAYAIAGTETQLAEIRDGLHSPRGTHLLSAFDPIVWHRARALELFDFDYRIECYTPKAKRRYGYFTLPILHEGQLVGRLDPKAHRQERRLEIKAIHLEPGVEVTSDLVEGIATALVHFATWQELDDVEVVSSDPPMLRRRLGPEIRAAWRCVIGSRPVMG